MRYRRDYDRLQLVKSFKLIKDTDENKHLLDRLITISTQKSNYSKKKKDALVVVLESFRAGGRKEGRGEEEGRR